MMKYKIPYEHFLKTFKKEQIKDIKDYNFVMLLHKKGYSRGQILEKRNITLDKLHQWRNTNMKPISVKILKKAEERGYFSEINNSDLEWLAYLVGYNLGDGNVSRNLCNTWFYGIDSDLEDIKKILLKFKVSPVIYTYKVNNGKMAIHDHVFSRFMVCLGAVSGDKTKTNFKVPCWIIKSGNASKIKQRFLQGFFDSELSALKLDKTRIFAYRSLKLYSCKHEDYVSGGYFFMEQIRNVLEEFRVKSSKTRLDRGYYRSRDKSCMQELFFIIYSNYFNIYMFIKNVGFLFNKKRRSACVDAFPKITAMAKNETDKIRKYEKAIKLRKEGLSAYKIAKILKIEAYHIKNWVYFNKKPRLYGFLDLKNN